jgi:eukaryotic-like serine/threonine-protein kinase
MEGFRSLGRSFLDAAALGLLAAALLYLPPAHLASHIDGWLFDSWSRLGPMAAPADMLLVDAPTPATLTPLAVLAETRGARLLISTLSDPPAVSTYVAIGPTEVPFGGSRSRPTKWLRGGHLWFTPDLDGVIRGDQTLPGIDAPVPSLPLYAARLLAADVHGTAPAAPTPNERLRFSTAHAFRALEAEEVFAQPESLNDQIVIAGDVTPIHRTPVGRLSSPELVAQILANYREQRWLGYGPTVAFARWLIPVLFLLPFVLGRWSTRRSAAIWLGTSAVAFVGVSAAGFLGLGVWLPLAGPETWWLVTGTLLTLRRPPKGRAPSPVEASDTLVEARRAAAAGQTLEAWSHYRGIATSPQLLVELYDLALELAEQAYEAEAADLYYRIAQVDSRFRDVAQRLVRANHPPPAQADEPLPLPATLGRYEPLEPIGKGATGHVYLARDPVINRIVALKVIDLTLDYEGTELQSISESFLREASIAGGLNHPNIVTIFDVGRTEGLAYIAMEYLKGQHLSDFAAPDRLLPADTVLELVGRAANALDYAHAHNVVHRDIKPANIMYDSVSDSLKLTDFGIAKLIDANRTRTGIVLGTPAFMSPEQLEGKNVNRHTDLFALGVSLYQLLTGCLPFRGASMTKLMFVIANEPHPAITTVRVDLPKWLDGVIDRALAKDPADRFQSGAEMAAALRYGLAQAA